MELKRAAHIFSQKRWLTYLGVFFAINAFLSLMFSTKLDARYQFFATKTHSMSPYIKPSDLLFVIKKPNMTYKIGDVITYHDYEHPGSTITHRIVELGGNVYITKGDRNSSVDPVPVRPRLIIGKITAVIPYVGLYVRALKSDVGNILLILLPAAVIIAVHIKRIVQKASQENAS